MQGIPASNYINVCGKRASGYSMKNKAPKSESCDGGDVKCGDGLIDKNLFHCAKSLEECPITSIILKGEVNRPAGDFQIKEMFEISKNANFTGLSEFRLTEGNGVCMINTNCKNASLIHLRL